MATATTAVASRAGAPTAVAASARTAPPAAAAAGRQQPRAHDLRRVGAGQVAAGQHPADQGEARGDQQAESGRGEPVADRAAGGSRRPRGAALRPRPRRRRGWPRSRPRRAGTPSPERSPRSPRRCPPAGRERLRRARCAGGGPPSRLSRRRGRRAGPRATPRCAGAGGARCRRRDRPGPGWSPRRAGRRRAAGAPEAGVVEPGLLGLLTDVPQESGEQIGDRYVGGHGQIDGDARRTYGQAARFGHRTVGHQQNSRLPCRL